VAGITAIIGGAFGAFFNLAAITMFSIVDLPRGMAVPDFMRSVAIVIWSLFFLCAVFVIVIGIQVIRLRNWARISLLVIAGCLLFFGVIGIGVIFTTIFIMPVPDPRVSRFLLASILAVTYGVPIAISLWWLILFTRSSVAAQFHSSAVATTGIPAGSPDASSFRLSKPGCPLAIRIVGWYLASFVLLIPFLPFTIGHFPALFFGHLFRGPTAFFIYLANFVLVSLPGFGLLLLKRWSYPLAIASQLFLCANGIATAVSPAYTEMMRSMLAQMNVPQLPPGTEEMLKYSRYFNLLGLVLPVAILVTLTVVRRQFFVASDADSGSAV
jgi:hypothetical protein